MLHTRNHQEIRNNHKKAWKYLWNRKRITAFAIIVISLNSVWQHPSTLFSWQLDVDNFIKRYDCLKGRLPKGEKIGYLSASDGSKTEFLLGFNDLKYFQINHALAPIVISNDPDAAWVIVDLPDEESGLEIIANEYNQDYLIIHNCENGLFIIYRSEKE